MDKRRKKLYEVKRTLRETPQGLKAYYFRNGKRIPDAKGRQKWIEQNFDALNKPYAKNQPQFTELERKTFNNSKAQRALYTYKGKKIPKVVTEVLKFFQDLNPSDPKEITKILNPDGSQRFRNFGQFEQRYEERKGQLVQSMLIAETKRGNIGHRGREEFSSIFSIAEHLQVLGVGGWKLLVIGSDGTPYAGKEKGLKAIQDYEMGVMNDKYKSDKKAAMTRFYYEIQYDFNTKTIIVDLNLSTDEADYSP